MRSWLLNLKVRAKLGLAAFALLLPLLLLLTGYALKSADDIRIARSELSGSRYFPELTKLILSLQRRRGAVALSATQGEAKELFARETQTALKAFSELKNLQLLSAVSEPQLAVTKKVETLLQQSPDADAAGLIAQHTEAIQELLAFARTIADKSQIDFDPEAETYYLLQIVTQQSLPFSENIGILRYRGVQALLGRNKDVTELLKLFGASVARQEVLLNTIERAISYLQEAEKPKLREALEGFNKAFSDWQKEFLKSVVPAARGQYAVQNAGSYFALATKVFEAIEAVDLIALEIAQQKLEARVLRLQQLLTGSLVLVLLLIGFSAWVGYVVLRQINESLAQSVIVAENMASGELDFDIHVSTRDEIGRFLQSLETMAERLRSVLQQVVESTREIALAAQQVASTAEMLNNGAMDQAAHVEETGAALGEMVSLIQSNAKNAIETDETATTAVKNTQAGAENVLRAVESMKQISERIQIVQEIASQTNLLALNATIEAARAGEHGRGFAVVATEVGKLAETSGQAAKQIQSLVKESSAISESAASSLKLIIDSMQETARKVVAIREASEEQSKAAQQISESMGRLNQTTEQTASAAEELAATAEEMSSQTSALLENLKFFRLGANVQAMPSNPVEQNSNHRAEHVSMLTSQSVSAVAGTEPQVKNPGSYEKF